MFPNRSTPHTRQYLSTGSCPNRRPFHKDLPTGTYQQQGGNEQFLKSAEIHLPQEFPKTPFDFILEL